MTSIVDPKFYPAFGALIYSYATVEVGIKTVITGLMETDMHRGFISTAPYPATQVANVAKVLAEEFVKPSLAKEITALVSRWQGHDALRIYIAHHRWRPGIRPNSIRPTYFDVRTGSLRVKGFDEKEKDYTVEEIFAAALDLSDINDGLKAFLEKTGLMAAIDKKTDALNASNA